MTDYDKLLAVVKADYEPYLAERKRIFARKMLVLSFMYDHREGCRCYWCDTMREIRDA